MRSYTTSLAANRLLREAAVLHPPPWIIVLMPDPTELRRQVSRYRQFVPTDLVSTLMIYQHPQVERMSQVLIITSSLTPLTGNYGMEVIEKLICFAISGIRLLHGWTLVTQVVTLESKL